MGGLNIYLPLNAKAGKSKLGLPRYDNPLHRLEVGEENQEQGTGRAGH